MLAARQGLYIIDLESTARVPRFLPQGGLRVPADVQWFVLIGLSLFRSLIKPLQPYIQVATLQHGPFYRVDVGSETLGVELGFTKRERNREGGRGTYESSVGCELGGVSSSDSGDGGDRWVGQDVGYPDVDGERFRESQRLGLGM